MFTSRASGCFLAAVLISLWSQAASAQTVREVAYQEKAVIPIHARLRYTTVIALPDSDEILDYLCGDKEYWIVNGARNLAYVKPAKAGGATNLTLVTSSGRIYTFLLQEGGAEADLKIFVTVDNEAPSQFGRRFYTAEDLSTVRTQLNDALAAAADAKREAQSAIETFRAQYPTQLHFDYEFDARKKPFGVTAIWHDGRFTFIRAAARELPALYEERDGQAQLVTYQVEHDTYIVPKVLEHGVLKLGKRSLHFGLSDSNSEGGR
jgi:type IV secretion system protein VirB9